MTRKREKYRAVQDYHPPAFAQSLAEDRVADFVRVWQFHQTFSATLPGLPPRPTLLDLVVSAYLQGVNDTVDVSIRKGMNFGEHPPCERACCMFIAASEEA